MPPKKDYIEGNTAALKGCVFKAIPEVVIGYASDILWTAFPDDAEHVDIIPDGRTFRDIRTVLSRKFWRTAHHSQDPSTVCMLYAFTEIGGKPIDGEKALCYEFGNIRKRYPFVKILQQMSGPELVQLVKQGKLNKKSDILRFLEICRHGQVADDYINTETVLSVGKYKEHYELRQNQTKIRREMEIAEAYRLLALSDDDPALIGDTVSHSMAAEFREMELSDRPDMMDHFYASPSKTKKNKNKK